MKNKLSVFVLLAALLLPVGGKVYGQEPTDPVGLDLYLSERGYMHIQLDKLPTGHLTLNAAVNGEPALFILDTGAGATVMDIAASGRFALEGLSTANQAAGAGGTAIALKQTSPEDFRIGDFLLDGFVLHLMELEHINGALRQLGIAEIDGVVGADVLTKGHAVIDFENMALYLQQ